MANAAGVSAMTVSNVINGHPNVRQATRDKVLEAMARLDYRVNVAARNLRKGRTGTIGLALPQIDSPYYSRLASCVIAAAGRHGLRVGIEQTAATRESELDALSLSRNRLYDGLLLSAVGLGQTDAERLTVDHPVVVLGDRITGGPVDHVGMPNLEASRAAVGHLIERGCRRIVLVCGDVDEVDTSSLRHAGYRRALSDAGLPEDPRLVRRVARFGLEDGARCARELVAGGLGFDGVFCVTDTLATGVLRGLADSGVPVPGRVKVIGFDNLAESAYLVPSLSSVDPDHDAMAERAVALLLTRIEQHEPPPRYEEFVSGFTLAIRESTGGPQGAPR
ncbi:LacI family DNA-binding transcriptional regulator [Streptomyces sp. NPDC004539]|uniref:LacI family DNA-binding transcriptional regulator n=1 Tax=Streptomyces sp. NPDC004539 TaxID=3154280 RepID=UPI0033AC27DE